MTDREIQPTRPPTAGQPLRVDLFVTCLVDLFRPSVGFAAIKLLEQPGCEVNVPLNQTCCGQAAYNNGDYRAARKAAQQVIESFNQSDYVVLPSGSCAGMISHHYPRLLEGQWRERALELAAKTFELTTFLSEIVSPAGGSVASPPRSSVAYHDSCAGLRELNIKQQPRHLLNTVLNTEVTELTRSEVCCGFGGTFCSKMPELSAKMADDKLADAAATGAKVLAGGDLGCLLALAGRAERQGINLEIRHVAELLAGDTNTPAIGKKQ